MLETANQPEGSRPVPAEDSTAEDESHGNCKDCWCLIWTVTTIDRAALLCLHCSHCSLRSEVLSSSVRFARTYHPHHDRLGSLATITSVTTRHLTVIHLLDTKQPALSFKSQRTITEIQWHHPSTASLYLLASPANNSVTSFHQLLPSSEPRHYYTCVLTHHPTRCWHQTSTPPADNCMCEP